MLEFMLRVACITGPAKRMYSFPGWSLSFKTHNNFSLDQVSIIQVFKFDSSKCKYIYKLCCLTVGFFFFLFNAYIVCDFFPLRGKAT